MGAKQSKRSLEISGTPKKGETENGAVAVPEEKLEKISEDAVAVKANGNGSTTTTSTLTAEQQEAAAAVTETESTPVKPEIEQTTEKSEEAAVTTPSEDKEEPSSPVSPSEPTEEGSAKKTKKSKKWSFRSWSFSKRDKVKPNVKEEKQETVPEDNEVAAQSETVNPEVTNVSCVQNEEPPPLPTSPPPTPAEEIPAEKEETLTTSEGDVDASGGGEGLAEPIEDAELEAAVAAPIAEKITETVQEVEAQLAAVTASPLAAEKVADAVEEAVAAVAELKVSTPPPVPAVTKHVEVAEDGELKVTSQIESVAAEQPLTNGVVEKGVNGINNGF